MSEAAVATPNPSSAVLSIDAEFKALIPPLSEEERSLLEESIVAEGCRDPIVTWGGIIVDGHNRYEICSEYEVPFATVEKAFESREAVKEWMLRNQLARRNLKRDQWTYLVGILYRMQKRDVGSNQWVAQNDPPAPTADRIAGQFGISPATVKRAETFANSVDLIAERDGPEKRQEILSGEFKQKDVIESAKTGAPLKKEQPNVHFMSETEEWYTPPDVLEPVIALLGAIDVDPCSNSHENPNVPATTIYTEEDDGLSQDWNGRVFMNPPYGREVAVWVEKALMEIGSGNVTEAIFLVASRTDTEWFNLLAERCEAWVTVKKRLHFSGHKNGAPFPSAVLWYHDGSTDKTLDDFCRAFGHMGNVWRRVLSDDDGGVL